MSEQSHKPALSLIADLKSSLVDLDRLISDSPVHGLPAVLAALSARVGTVAAKLAAAGMEGRERSVEPSARDQNLTVDQAARRLGVSRDYLYRQAKSLPFALRIGRRLFFSEAGLERWNRRRQGLGT